MGAAAELARDAFDLDHPHPLAVFLAEEGHRAERFGLGPLHLDPADRGARLDPLVDPVLDVAQLVGAERLAVGEVEAQFVGADRRARLADVGAEPLAQRRVQEVRRGVVAHRRVARLAVDDGLDRDVVGAARRPLDLDHLVGADPVDVGDPPLAARPAQHARVGDLAAALGVEGAVLELRAGRGRLPARSPATPVVALSVS